VAMTKRSRVMFLATVLVVALCAVALWSTPAGERVLRRFGLGALGQNGQTIRVSGNIEVINVEMSFKIPGRVTERPVDEGETVAAGALVASLETTDLLCDVAARRADLALATATLAELENGSRPEEKAVAAAAVRSAEAEEVRLKSERDRATQLVKDNAVSREAFDRATAGYDVAVERLKQTRDQRALVEKGAREEVRDQARARVKQAQAALDLAETRLKYAMLRWPPEGVVLSKTAQPPQYVVLSKNVEPGEYVAPGTPVVTVGEMVNVWLRAYINESDLGRVKVGQTARVTADTYPGKVYEGRISFVAPQAEFTPKNVQTQKERVKLVYRIKIDIANPNMELKPGMPADAEIVVAEE